MEDEKVFAQPLSFKYTITLNTVFGDRFIYLRLQCAKCLSRRRNRFVNDRIRMHGGDEPRFKL